MSLSVYTISKVWQRVNANQVQEFKKFKSIHFDQRSHLQGACRARTAAYFLVASPRCKTRNTWHYLLTIHFWMLCKARQLGLAAKCSVARNKWTCVSTLKTLRDECRRRRQKGMSQTKSQLEKQQWSCVRDEALFSMASSLSRNFMTSLVYLLVLHHFAKRSWDMNASLVNALFSVFCVGSFSNISKT
jgi:hypothetical protein